MRETVAVVSGRVISVWRVAAYSLTEAEARRQLWLAAGGLILLGIVLLIGTVWWWLSTRPESPALAPLEVMSGRRWAHASEAERRRLADAVRPHPIPTEEAPEPIPLDEARVPDPEGDRFDDLREFDELLGIADGAPGGADEAAADAAEVGEPVAAAEGLVPDDERPEEAVAADQTIALDEDPDADQDEGADAHHFAGDAEEDDDVHGDDDETHMIAIDPLLRLSRPD